MKLRFAALALTALISFPAAATAHDFWLEVDRWQAEGPDERVEARFLVGHAGDRGHWAMRLDRVVSLRVVGPGFVADAKHAITLPQGDEGARAALHLLGEGSYVAAFETDNAAYSDLPAEKFNAYLEEEGITPAIEERRKRAEENTRGRERYSRRAKALIQVGGVATENILEPLGHTLEITPLDNPFSLPEDAPLRVEVRYKGAPVEGVLLHFESLDIGLLPEAKARTDAAGVAAFRFPRRGAWKLNAVWTEPIDGDPKADFDTVFASLTFGY